MAGGGHGPVAVVLFAMADGPEGRAFLPVHVVGAFVRVKVATGSENSGK